MADSNTSTTQQTSSSTLILRLPEIPLLYTERLILRGFQECDVAPFAMMLASKRVGRFKGFANGASPAESWAGVANIIGHWCLRGFGLLAVECRKTRTFIGCVGVIEPHGWPGPEITWTLNEEVWGQGFATEAAKAVRQWAFSTLQIDRLVSMIHPENAASLRVAMKLGARYERNVHFWGESTGLYAMQRTTVHCPVDLVRPTTSHT